MTREDHRLMLCGSALTGLMAQHIGVKPEPGRISNVEAAHYTEDQLADAALKSVKVADLTLRALGARVPDALDIYDALEECWAFLGKLASGEIREHLICDEASNLLYRQKGGPNAR